MGTGFTSWTAKATTTTCSPTCTRNPFVTSSRLAHNRNLIGTSAKLKDLARESRHIFYRDIQLSPRPKLRELDRKAIHRPRDARSAKLAVSALAVEIRRSNNVSVQRTPSVGTAASAA